MATPSAAFTVDSASVTGAVSVTGGATVNLALVSTAGVNSVEWSVVATDSSGTSAPTITPAGTPSGATASYTAPSTGAILLRCRINGGVDENGDRVSGYTAQAVIGVNDDTGSPPFVVGETTERSSTYGSADALNDKLVTASTTGSQRAQAVPSSLLTSAAGYWSLADVLTDASGNGNTLAASAGSPERFTQILPGLKGYAFSGSQSLEVAADAAYQLTGDVTFGMIVDVIHQQSMTGTQVLLEVGNAAGADGTEANNTLYSIYLTADGARLYATYQHEEAGGANVTYSPKVGTDELCIPMGPCLIGVTRESNVVKFYLNGELWGAASSTLTAPTGGGSAKLTLGDNASGSPRFRGHMASVFIDSDPWDADKWKSAYNQSLGRVLGAIS